MPSRQAAIDKSKLVPAARIEQIGTRRAHLMMNKLATAQLVLTIAH